MRTVTLGPSLATTTGPNVSHFENACSPDKPAVSLMSNEPATTEITDEISPFTTSVEKSANPTTTTQIPGATKVAVGVVAPFVAVGPIKPEQKTTPITPLLTPPLQPSQNTDEIAAEPRKSSKKKRDGNDSDTSSVWTNGVTAAADLIRQNASGTTVNNTTSGSFSTSRTSSEIGRPNKVFPNLAALAASAIRQRKPRVQVRYYAQVDMQSIAYRRHRLVKKRYDFHLRLEESDLIITRRPRKRSAAAAMAAASGDSSDIPTISTIDAAKRTIMNVRMERVLVDHNKCEIILYRKERERPLRLALKSSELCAQWDRALKNAKTCHIRQFYELGPTVGRGAYGEVVQATDLNSKETRAVKIVKRGTTPKSIEHLSRELKVMQSVSHPGIVQTYQIFEGKTIYMVMEYVPGGDLFDFVASQDILTEAQGAQTLSSIVGAVAYLHNANIVHRDLKPENILCRKKAWPLETKITDFGFSTLLNPAVGDSVMRTPVGTAYFMAPEIITSQGHGPPVDIWACGVILYTILTGRLPFPGRNRDEYFRSVAHKKALFPPSLWKGISQDALNLVKGMLNKDPKIRLTALGVLQHKWISDPKNQTVDMGIKRNRQNLHSRRRRLYKARSAIIAVAMAQKFKATALVDLIEKMPGGVEKLKENTTRFVHKTADGIMDTGDKLGEGTRKVAENVGEGTRKFKENVGEGTRKFGEGTKKFAEKAEQGAKKMGEGVKKTGEGIKKGAEKAGAGVKKTKEELKDGAKKAGEKTKEGVKKAGEGIKKGAEKVKIDKIKLDKLKIPLDNLKPKFGGSTADSHTGPPNRRGVFRKKVRPNNHADEVDDVQSSAPSNQSQRVVHLDENGREIDVGLEEGNEIAGKDSKAIEVQAEGDENNPVVEKETEKMKSNVASVVCALGERTMENNTEEKLEERGQKLEFSNVSEPQQKVTGEKKSDEKLETEIGVEMKEEATRMDEDSVSKQVSNLSNVSDPATEEDKVAKQDSHLSNVTDERGNVEKRPRSITKEKVEDAIEKHSSQISNESASVSASRLLMRPKLAPLATLGLGWGATEPSDAALSGSSDDGDDATGALKLRKTAALLLATSDLSNPRSGDGESSSSGRPKTDSGERATLAGM